MEMLKQPAPAEMPEFLPLLFSLSFLLFLFLALSLSHPNVPGRCRTDYIQIAELVCSL